ncbi:hypothetical protein ACFQ2B_39865 [Streptomyces stramineus]
MVDENGEGSLRELEPGEEVRQITFRDCTTARAVRYENYTGLGLRGCPRPPLRVRPAPQGCPGHQTAHPGGG